MMPSTEEIKSVLEGLDEKKIVDILGPFVVKSTLDIVEGKVEGKIGDKIKELKETVSKDIWDKSMSYISEKLQIPKEIVNKLKSLDDDVAGALTKAEEFVTRMKGIDLNQTVTMTYSQLIKEKAKAASYWAIAGFFIGMALMVILLWGLGVL